MKLVRHTLTLAAILLPLAAQAQQPTTRGATVTGTILCADTSAPARFAKVLLKSTTPKSGFGDDFIGQMQKLASQMGGSDAKPTDEDNRRLAAASKAMNQATDMLSSSTVGLDGAFTLTGIQPGTYYVHAVFPGYIDPISEVHRRRLRQRGSHRQIAHRLPPAIHHHHRRRLTTRHPPP